MTYLYLNYYTHVLQLKEKKKKPKPTSDFKLKNKLHLFFSSIFNKIRLSMKNNKFVLLVFQLTLFFIFP